MHQSDQNFEFGKKTSALKEKTKTNAGYRPATKEKTNEKVTNK